MVEVCETEVTAFSDPDSYSLVKIEDIGMAASGCGCEQTKNVLGV